MKELNKQVLGAFLTVIVLAGGWAINMNAQIHIMNSSLATMVIHQKETRAVNQAVLKEHAEALKQIIAANAVSSKYNEQVDTNTEEMKNLRDRLARLEAFLEK
jgi:hypothetical protein